MTIPKSKGYQRSGAKKKRRTVGQASVLTKLKINTFYLTYSFILVLKQVKNKDKLFSYIKPF